jgi:hypothetical protein
LVKSLVKCPTKMGKNLKTRLKILPVFTSEPYCEFTAFVAKWDSVGSMGLGGARAGPAREG